MDNRAPETLEDLKQIAQQLHLESKIDRIPVSEAANTIISFCQTNANDDPLLTGIPASMNPYKEKKSCCLI